MGGRKHIYQTVNSGYHWAEEGKSSEKECCHILYTYLCVHVSLLIDICTSKFFSTNWKIKIANEVWFDITTSQTKFLLLASLYHYVLSIYEMLLKLISLKMQHRSISCKAI